MNINKSKQLKVIFFVLLIFAPLTVAKDLLPTNSDTLKQAVFAEKQSLPETPDLQKSKSYDDQKNIDEIIGIAQWVTGVMAVAVAIITLLFIIAIAIGFFEYRQWKKIRKGVEKSLQEAKKSAEESKKCVEEAKSFLEGLKKMYEEAENIRKSIGTVPPLSELPSEDIRKKIEKFGERIEFLEAFGIQLKHEDYYNKGVDFYYKGQYESALKAFDKAIEIKPDYVEAWDGKGYCLSKIGRVDEALELHNKAIKIDPNYANAWYNIAYAYSLKGDKVNALANLSKAIKIDPNYKNTAKKDEDLKILWSDEDFKKIVE